MPSVLVVDDNPDDLLLVSRMLRQEFPDMQVQTAGDEPELTRLIGRPFDLVITDYHLGFTTGLAVKDQVKSLDPTCPVILFTVTTSEDEMLEAMRSGLEDYALKTPKQQRQLLRAVHHALAQRSERRAHQQTEAQLEQVLQTAAEAIVRLDAEGRVTGFNPAAEAMFIYSEAEAAGRHVTKLIIPLRSRNKHLHELEHYLSEAPPDRPFRTTLRRGDGELFSAEVCLRRLESEGQVRGFVYHVRDVGERERTEAALRQAEQRLRGLIEHNTDGIVLLDDAGAVRFASASTARLLGHAPETLTGEAVTRWVHPEDRPSYQEALSRALRQPGSEIEVAVRLLHLDGAWRHTEGILTNLLDVAGVDALTYHFRDVSERRRYEHELEVMERVRWALRYAGSAQRLAQNFLEEVLQGFDSESGCVVLLDPDQVRVRVSVRRGWFADLPANPSMTQGQSIGSWVVQHAKPYLTASFADDRLTDPQARPVTPQGWGGIVLPLLSQGCTIGLVYLALPRPRALTREERRLLERVCEIAAHALSNQILREENLDKEGRLSALQAIDRAIAGHLDLHATLEVVLAQSLERLEADAAGVLVYHPDEHRLRFAAGLGFRSESPVLGSLPLGQGSYAGQAAAEGRVLHVADLRVYPGGFGASERFREEGFVAYWAVPLVSQSGLQGVLELFSRAPAESRPDRTGFMASVGLQAAIAVESARMRAQVQGLGLRLDLASDGAIEALAAAVDMRDSETEQHSQRVAGLAVRLAQALRVPDADLVHLRRGALLHDIGKLAVPDAILRKPGPLTPSERLQMQRHPEYALRWLAPIAFLAPALDIPYAHHERWDGSGYPRGLRGHAIPLAARVFAVVDVYDALTSSRPYREAWPPAAALDYLAEQRGVLFDPQAVDAFLALMRQEQAA